MSDEETREVTGLKVNEIVGLAEQDDGSIAIVVSHDGGELAFVISTDQADELAGALIERPLSQYNEAFGSNAAEEVDVTEHEIQQLEPDSYMLRVRSGQGPILTFRMGTQRLRRIRNMMTAQLARHLTKRAQ